MKMIHETHQKTRKKIKIIRVNSCNSWASFFFIKMAKMVPGKLFIIDGFQDGAPYPGIKSKVNREISNKLPVPTFPCGRPVLRNSTLTQSWVSTVILILTHPTSSIYTMDEAPLSRGGEGSYETHPVPAARHAVLSP